MARIQSVDYEAMPGQAKEMRGYARQLNAEMSKAYTSLANMHNDWYGKRYNELVKQFNNLTAKINEMLTLVVTQVPYALETVANNYSQADRGQNVTTASNEEPKKIANITISNDVGMKFITSNVANTQNSISANFKNAKDQMNKIESVYLKIQWQSEAGEAFKTKFMKLKKDIVASFDDIDTQFTSLMKQTQQDIETIEKANTVN